MALQKLPLIILNYSLIREIPLTLSDDGLFANLLFGQFISHYRPMPAYISAELYDRRSVKNKSSMRRFFNAS